ncbi:leucine--tRNA ligase [Niabella drilacis]|uniref:Leucine--tRNA ligase n=1 Tax=Niabella drilacis (strain DSM 25811 / CCM 8410 / CCUG 62505 / LMG 26954 / E90) TaxID=1285928 RepID=A0A1G6XVP1_NIADE|nr:leucine--tRNA ligase [Niabella drilacis]SDD81485.1 leucyl-tRNA synthetase [Niabella drilacis]
MEYNFNEIEKKWQHFWAENGTYTVSNKSSKPKYYVLDMFPYPSGAGLHVGHPLGYIASDIYARYKRLKGFNVLHPMGYDAFGLPAEQYALENGIHPAVSTDKNISTFRKQLDNIGFGFDWSREVRTSDPQYYKWTQWIFLQLFESYFDRQQQKAMPIHNLVALFEQHGSAAPGVKPPAFSFTADEWKSYSEAQKLDILMEYRLAYCGYGEVNWCEALGTVLANDEVVNGVSERGSYPVVKKKLRQWYLRITEYADRLLEGLQRVDFSEAMKEMQSNWIGKSSGAEIKFSILNSQFSLTVYTTRPDTIFGVDFMVIAPELELVDQIKTPEQAAAVDEYIAYVKSRSERERMAEKKISGVFTGAYAINPFDGRQIPIWISEYVLAGYGTGAIMAVPCGDERDFKFAKHFDIPITNIIGSHFNGEEANATKDAVLENSGFLNGVPMREAMETVIRAIEEKGIGTRKVNYKMRDAAFSRQRYWGEPFPIQWKKGTAYPMNAAALPLELPTVDSYKPGPEGEGPLANIPEWVARELETNTMPGYAGSSWYFLRYMDPKNDQEFAGRAATDYWNQVDLYIGGTEHAVGHLLYSRMWTKALHDLGYIGFDEPFKRLVNQGMIQGSSRFVYRINGTNEFVSQGLIDADETYNGQVLDKIHVDVNIVDGTVLNREAFVKWRNNEFSAATFILEDGKYICGAEVEKMSKSKFNTVNPDDLVNKYGADTFRMYEMFLGPVEMSKPWDTKGIEGVHRFLKKLWRLFYKENADGSFATIWTNDAPTAAELKVLHKSIKKIEDDNERFSFNTGVSAFMILVNELTDLKCHKKQVLEPVLTMLSSYAPHIAEELWHALGNNSSVLDASFPVFEEKYIKESDKEYPISINGKMRTTMTISLEASQPDVEQLVLNNEIVQKWMDGKPPKKIIFVKNKMVNVVV